MDKLRTYLAWMEYYRKGLRETEFQLTEHVRERFNELAAELSDYNMKNHGLNLDHRFCVGSAVTGNVFTPPLNLHLDYSGEYLCGSMKVGYDKFTNVDFPIAFFEGAKAELKLSQLVDIGEYGNQSTEYAH